MLTMTDLQSCVARLHKLNPPVDAVAEDFDGPPEWSSSDTGVCTATAAEDGLSALIAPVGASYGLAGRCVACFLAIPVT